MNYISLINKAEQLHILSKDEIIALLLAGDAEAELFLAADRVRHEFVGDGVLLRGLIEFSSYCRRNCCYCGLRRDNLSARRFRLSDEEIFQLAEQARDFGYQTVVLQSGEDMAFTAARLAGITARIKELNLAVTLSIGERERADYEKIRAAGADRFLLRIETTDKAVYKFNNPGMSWEERYRCLKDLKELGYEVGTGSLIGLPGQTVDSLADDILFFQEIDADMVGIGPLVPNADTPLGHAAAGDIKLVLRMVALIRLLLPEANIPATTAMETVLPSARLLALQCGANVVMPNVTGGPEREKYALYPGKAEVADTPADCADKLDADLKKIGRFIRQEKGYRVHKILNGSTRDIE